MADEFIQSAIIRQLEIAGEAAGRLSEEFRQSHPELEARWVRVAPCKLKGHMPPEMAARVKPSQRPGTESCVVRGNLHGEA